MATPQLLFSALAKAYSFVETRFSGDPEYLEAIQEALNIHAGLGWTVFRICPEGVFVGGQLLPDRSEELLKFQGDLEKAGIQEVRLQETPTVEALEEFFRRLHPSSALEGSLPSARFRGMEEVRLSFREAEGTLPGMVGGVLSLFEGRPSAGPRESQTETATPETGSTQAREPSASRDGISPELASEVATFLGSDGVLKEESAHRLRAWVARLSESRNFGALGEVVQLLAEPGGEYGEDPEAVALAREFTTPAVSSHLAVRVASTSDDQERARLTEVVSRIGEEAALAIADALGESRDRSQRRALVDVLVALGPPGGEMARGMLKDPRWFVVRNGVAILGELGGEDAVEHLAPTLANEDRRVRKEAVSSLAKLGGAPAEKLLLGMMEDGEVDVRVAACRAMGALGTAEGVKPLIQRLKDKSSEVQVESLRALGRIGASESIQAIEKKALGGWFSRPPQEIRMAAYRALASIGTARAIRALQKGAKDGDARIRLLVKDVLSGS